MHQSAKVLLEARRDKKKKGEKRKKEKGRRKMTEKRERERKKVGKEKEGKKMRRLYRSRLQAAPTPETSHGFRGSAGLKGITLS